MHSVTTGPRARGVAGDVRRPKLRKSMNAFLVTLQLLLLPPMAALAVLAHRTSRAHRSRHAGFLGLAFLIGLAAAAIALISLALALGDDEVVDPLLTFVPPSLTLLAGLLVARRGLARPTRLPPRR